MNKKALVKVKDNKRTLYFRPLPETRSDGVCAVLVGYRKAGVDQWY